MGEKLFFHWETQVIVITIVFELIMISSIIYKQTEVGVDPTSVILKKAHYGL